MKNIELSFVSQLKDCLKEPDALIQVVLGPRQVGKTTGVDQLIASLPPNTASYFSADGAVSKDAAWFHAVWTEAKSDSAVNLLVVDEIQNVEHWSGIVKKLWDAQRTVEKKLKLVLLGSSSLEIQRGLHESLAGRFFTHIVPHWSFEESRDAYALSFEDYLVYGGYPGSYRYIRDTEAWLSYMRTSIVDAVVGKDILQHAQVKSPALFRQCFDIISAYPAQEISYTKLLGQLQEKGNTDLVKSYIEHYEAAFLMKQLFKYSTRALSLKTSSSKLLPACPALFSMGQDACLNSEQRGRSFEVAVGMALMRLPGRLSYWRHRTHEVDYVYEYQKRVTAIEVKSGRKQQKKGLFQFCERHPGSCALLVSPQNLGMLSQLLG